MAEASPTLRNIVAHKVGENLEILDPPSMAEWPAAPDRLTIAASGLGIGLFLGGIDFVFRTLGHT